MPGYFRDDTIKQVVADNGESLTLNQAVAIASAFQYVGERAEAYYGGVDDIPEPLQGFLREVAEVTFELVPRPKPAEVQEVSFADLGLSVEDLDRIFGL